MEINSHFIKDLNNNYPKIHIYNASAKDIKKYLHKHKQDNCDCIISGIPWATLTQDLQEDLLNKLY